MKKVLIGLMLVLVVAGTALAVDYAYLTWTPTTSTTTFNVRDNSVVKLVKLINATTAYINFEVKASSADVDYVLVAPRSTVETAYQKIYSGFTVSIAPNQPPIGGFDGGVSSSTAVGTQIKYSR